MLGESNYKILWSLLLVSVVTVSCARKSKVEEASGDVAVQIASSNSDSNYSVQVVTLKGIKDLQEVAGAFVKFFYAPGADNEKLTGAAPKAHFMRTTSFFVPSDLISLQMVTIYYHLQNLAEIDSLVGAGGVNQWPRSVGIETQIAGNPYMSRNNAFYNGQTDSMMFVPFTLDGLPISVNAGIIAHEHFHSLFYKLVLRPNIGGSQQLTNAASIHSVPVLPKISVTKIQAQSDDKERALLYNETLLRGINEGMADYWGWYYTSDPDFIRWSLPSAEADRTLAMSESETGVYATKNTILGKVDAAKYDDNPGNVLAGYAYEVGTPHARFLKQFTVLQIENQKIDLSQAKNLVGHVVIQYLNSLSKKVQALKETDFLETKDFFNFFAQQVEQTGSGLKLNDKNCEFLLHYVNSELATGQKPKVCGQNNLGQLTITEGQ